MTTFTCSWCHTSDHAPSAMQPSFCTECVQATLQGRGEERKAPTPLYRKEIAYDRETRDYRMELDGELVGFARTYHEAEVTLDQLVFELIGGASFTAARPAEVVEFLATRDVCDESVPEAEVAQRGTDAVICGDCRRELAYCATCGAPGTTTNPDEDYICERCQAAATLFACPCGQADPIADALASTSPFTRTLEHDIQRPFRADAWACGAHIFWTDPAHMPLSCPRCSWPLPPHISADPAICIQCGAPSDPAAALLPELPLCTACGAMAARRLLCVIFSTGPRCPECAEPVVAVGVWCPECACAVCSGSHRATQCPEIAAAHQGMVFWEQYIEGRAAFLERVRQVSAPVQLGMAGATATYLTARMGGELTAAAVMHCWSREIATLGQDKAAA